MFVLERLIGVGIYALLLLLVCLSLIGKGPKKIKRILFLYTVALSILAFFYVPYETADLYRIYDTVDLFSKYSFQEVLEHQAQRGEWGIANLLYWAIGQIGIPQLLPALTTFVCYNCVFYIVNKTAVKNNVSGKNVAVALFFYMSTGTYIFVISGIRSMLGICILAFCFYRESVEGKFHVLHIPLYLFSVLIHSFVAVLTAIRFFAPIFSFRRLTPKRIAYLCALGGAVVLVPRYFSSYINQIAEKAEGYLTGDMYSYIWEYVIAGIVLSLLLLIALKSEKAHEHGAFKCYLFICVLVALCFCYEFSIFHRTIVYILPIISIPLLMNTLQEKENTRIAQKPNYAMSIYDRPLTYQDMIVAASGIILLLSCARGSLCSLKFFVL